jgi:hypothetical protein
MQIARRFLDRYASVQAFQEIKAKYCPDGQTCEAVVGMGMIVGFIYVLTWPFFNYL